MSLIRYNSYLLRLLQNTSNLMKYNNGGYVIPIINNTKGFSNDSKTENKLERIYYGLLTPQIKAVKVVSFTTSLGGVAAQPILIKQISAIEGGLPIVLSLCGVVGFFTFVTPFLLHMVTKKYIINMDYDPKNDKYIATTLSFFCLQKKIVFSAEDVVVPDLPGMFTSFKVKEVPLFVDPNLFQNAYHYGKLMGYHKPIDFKLTNVSNDDKKKT